MICTQDLWAIKSMLEDFKDYCTCEEAVGNLINEVEKEIDERDNIQKADCYCKALEEIEQECLNDTYTFADGKQIRYDTLDDILNIINEAKGEGDE